MLEIVRILAGMILVFVLPGAALVEALFPRKGDLDIEYDLIYRIFLSMGFSVVLTIIVGFILNMLGLKDDGTGYFTTMNLVIALLSLTFILAAVAWFRGAFPWLGRIHASLYREPPPGKYEMGDSSIFVRKEDSREIEDLSKKRITLNRRLTVLSRAPDAEDTRIERKAVLSQLEEVMARLEELENKRRGT